MSRFHVIFTLPLLCILISSAVADRKLTVNNACSDTLWPAVTSYATVSSSSTFSNIGWQADSNTSFSITLPDQWSGRIWARQSCDSSGANCAVGDCGDMNCTSGVGGTAATLMEFSLAGSGGEDFYDISLVDGANVPVEIKTSTACPSVDCSANFTVNCPSDLRGPVENGKVLSCLGPCLNQTTASTDCANEEYYNWYHQYCPSTYVSPYDADSGALQSNITCPGGQTADYTLTFCPIGWILAAAPGESNSTTSSSSASSTSSASFSSGSSTPVTTNDSKTLSGGAIGGIVVGCVIGAVGLGALLFWLRHQQKRKEYAAVDLSAKNTRHKPPELIVEPFMGEDRHLSPHDNSDPGTRNSSPLVTAGAMSKRDLLAREQETMRERSNSGLLSEGLASASSSHSRSDPSAIPLPPSSAVESLGPPPLEEWGHSNIDIEQLFEDRDPVFENQLLNFLQQRMDRPGPGGMSAVDRLRWQEERARGPDEASSEAGTDLPRYPGN